MHVTRIIPAVVLLLLATALPAPAHADWSRPVPLDPDGWGVTQHSVAVDRDEDTGSGIRYRRVGRNGALGPIHTVPGTDPSNVDGQLSVAVDADGDALFTWIKWAPYEQIWQVMAQRVHRDDSVEPAVLLSGPTSSWIPQAALTPDGHGAVLFDESDAGVNSSHQVLVRISANGTPGRRWTLPVAHNGTPLLATPAGDFVTLGARDGRVVGYRLLPDDRLRSDAISTRRSGTVGHVTMGIGRRGAAHVVYAAGRDGHPTRLWARRWERDGALTRVRRITPAGQAAGTVSAAVDGDGDMVIAWPSYQLPGPKVIAYSRVWRHDGSVGPTRRLGDTTGWKQMYFDIAPLVAVDADGDGVLVWASRDPEGADTTWARQMKRSGDVGPRFVLADDTWPSFAASTPQGRGRVGVGTGLMLSDER